MSTYNYKQNIFPQSLRITNRIPDPNEQLFTNVHEHDIDNEPSENTDQYIKDKISKMLQNTKISSKSSQMLSTVFESLRNEIYSYINDKLGSSSIITTKDIQDALEDNPLFASFNPDTIFNNQDLLKGSIIHIDSILFQDSTDFISIMYSSLSEDFLLNITPPIENSYLDNCLDQFPLDYLLPYNIFIHTTLHERIVNADNLSKSSTVSIINTSLLGLLTHSMFLYKKYQQLLTPSMKSFINFYRKLNEINYSANVYLYIDKPIHEPFGNHIQNNNDFMIKERFFFEYNIRSITMNNPVYIIPRYTEILPSDIQLLLNRYIHQEKNNCHINFIYSHTWEDVNQNYTIIIETIENMKDLYNSLSKMPYNPPWGIEPQQPMSIYIYADLWYYNEIIPIIYRYISLEDFIYIYTYNSTGQSKSHDDIYTWLTSKEDLLLFSY
ncbi:hypothetical protein WA158_004982 [Blastocystis sp. Blastoise]